MNLIEWTVCLLITGILLLSTMSLGHTWTGRGEREQMTEQLITQLKTARELAIMSGLPVTFRLCPKGPSIIQKHRLVRTFPGMPKNWTLTWQGNFHRAGPLVFLPNGQTQGQQGHFSLTSPSRHRTQVVLSSCGHPQSIS